MFELFVNYVNSINDRTIITLSWKISNFEKFILLSDRVRSRAALHPTRYEDQQKEQEENKTYLVVYLLWAISGGAY